MIVIYMERRKPKTGFLLRRNGLNIKLRQTLPRIDRFLNFLACDWLNNRINRVANNSCKPLKKLLANRKCRNLDYFNK